MFTTTKKYGLLICSLVFVAINASAQKGYVQDETIKVPGILNDTQIYGLNLMQKTTTITYVDGLDRGQQTIAVQGSPLQNDLIQAVVYDAAGRQTTSYLPYVGKSTDAMGSYRPNAISTDQPAFYNNTSQHLVATDASPYSSQVMDNSPLQRLLQSGMVGSGFQPGVSGSHYKTISYRYNNSSDSNILVWNPDGTFTTGNYYAVNTLAVTDGKDEDNTEILTFTDLTGHLILKRQLLNGSNLDTYYIYNNAGMPAYIVPPLATNKLVANSYNLSVAPLSNLVFKFIYDTMGRLVEKTVPAKGTMFIVYDPLNRPVLMQDNNLQAVNKWNYIKYDVKGRAISQGFYTDATHAGRVNMQGYVNTLAGSYNAQWYEARTATLTDGGYYTSAIFPTSATGTLTPLAYLYYDDYDMNQDGTADFSYSSQGLPNEETATTAQVKGMPTVVSKATVGTGLSNVWLTTVTFYDKRGNAIQVKSNNQLYYTNAATLTDTKTVVPDFMGVAQVTKVSKQTASATTVTVQTSTTYDHMYRLKTISQQYNGGIVTQTAAYDYNELGQIITKNLGQLSAGVIPSTLNLNTAYTGTNAVTASSNITLSNGFSVPAGSSFRAYISTNCLQSVDYRYNVRGQLLSINNSKLNNDGGITSADGNDLFGMQMLYDQADANLGNNPYYNGKMSAVKWMSKDGYNNSSYERAFSYSYDGINRYTGETYSERTTIGTGAFNNNQHGFDEQIAGYDAAGNILNLYRNSSTQGTNSNTQIDNLTYSYDANNPNRLLTVTDATGNAAGFNDYTASTGSYGYDGNGNLTADPYKGLGLTYDDLNRTEKITMTYQATNRWIDYTYDASGNLLRKRQYDNNTLQTTTDYIEGFVYVNGTLSYFPMPEGRVLNLGGILQQEFVITDQQGNARISFQDNGTGRAIVKQENSYYGFGLIMGNSPVATPSVPNKQLYNGGSEWQNDFSNLPDYYQTLNRNYDASLGRFMAVDPVAESTDYMTVYQYAGNNPIVYNDPLGDVYNGGGSLNDPNLVGRYGLNVGGSNPGIGFTDNGSNSASYGGNHGGHIGFDYNADLLERALNGDPLAAQQYGYQNGTALPADSYQGILSAVRSGNWSGFNFLGSSISYIQDSYKASGKTEADFSFEKISTTVHIQANQGGNTYDPNSLTGIFLNSTGNTIGMVAMIKSSFLASGMYKNAAGNMASYTALAKYKPSLSYGEQTNLSKAFNSYVSGADAATWGARGLSAATLAWDVSQGAPREVVIGDGALWGMSEIPFIGPPTAAFLWLNSFIRRSPSSNFANPGREPGHYAEWLH